METTPTKASATRSLISQLGAGSGIDMAALAENLAAAQFAARTDRLALRSEVLEARISAASDLKSMMLSLATSLGNRVRMGDLSPQPRIANTAVAGVSRKRGRRRNSMLASRVLATPSALTAVTRNV